MEKYFKYLLLGLIGVLLLSLPAGTPSLKAYSKYSIFNTGEHGCSNIAIEFNNAGFDIVPIYSSYDEYDFSENGVIFIIGPQRDFSKEEINNLKKFLESGNTIIVADDFGTSNRILNELQIPDRFSGERINDIFYRTDQNVIEVKNPEIYGGGSVVTYVPSYIRGSGTIGKTSNISKSDQKKGSLPIISEIMYSEGKIILIADPDIFTNQLSEYNSEFIENFISRLNYNQIYFDEIHHNDLNYELNIFYVQKTIPKEYVLMTILAITFSFRFLNKETFRKTIEKFIPQKSTDVNNYTDKTLTDVSNKHKINSKDLIRVINIIKDGKNGRKRIS